MNDMLTREAGIRIQSALSYLDISKKIPESLLENIQGSYQELEVALMTVLGSLRLDTTFLGELDLNGKLLPTKQLAVLNTPHPNLVVAGSQAAIAKAFYPEKSVYGLLDLEQVLAYCNQPQPVEKPVYTPEHLALGPIRPDLAKAYTDTLDVLKTGGVPLLVGKGATAVARRLTQGMDLMTEAEAVEVSKIHAHAGFIGADLLRNRPFRVPHYTISLNSLLGCEARPGVCQLARMGVLFLEDVQQFPEDALREVLSVNRRDPNLNLVLADENPSAQFITEYGVEVIETA